MPTPLAAVGQDGSVLQTVVAGSGAIQNMVWIPDVGVAVCSNRSKVSGPDVWDHQCGWFPFF